MEFRLLGPLEVDDDGKPISLGGAKQRALFAILLLDRGRAVSTDRLIDEIWAGKPPQTAGKSIQVYVSGLRKALGEARLVPRERGYEWRVELGETDVDRFDELMRTASEAPPANAALHLEEALRCSLHARWGSVPRSASDSAANGWSPRLPRSRRSRSASAGRRS